MKKRYKVTWQDDRLESVEVDGVRYTDPRDIADRRDRAAVQRLLARLAMRRGEPFDDAEFDADMQRLERETEGVPRVIVAVFLGVGLLLLLIAVTAGVFTARSLAREVRGQAVIAAVTTNTGVDGQTLYYPVVDFTLPDGESYSTILADGSSSANTYRVGQEAAIRYDPQRPDTARIDSLSNMLLQWLASLITGFIGLVFLVVTLGIAWLARAERRADGANKAL